MSAEEYASHKLREEQALRQMKNFNQLSRNYFVILSPLHLTMHRISKQTNLL